MIMKSVVNKNGVKVEIGKWYNFYNLKSGAATERLKVTDFIVDSDGVCRTVKTKGKLWFDVSSRWLNWVFS